MNEQDVRALLALNKSNYPHAYRDMVKAEVEALVKSWSMALEPYPAALVQAAYLAALTRCRFPVTLADIFDELRAARGASQPPPERLWQELVAAADYCAAKEWRFDFNGPSMKYPGLTQGEGEIRECRERLAGLSGECRAFIGNLSRLIDFGRMDSAAREGLHFGRFRRFVEEQRKRDDVPEYLREAAALLLEG